MSTRVERKRILLKKLKDAANNYDTESAHADADDALIEFINDVEITEAYKQVAKWYA